MEEQQDNEPSMLHAARRYAENGWRVLLLHWPRAGGCSCGDPNCSKIGKHPIGKLTEATNDVEQVVRWWTEWPDANIGLTLETIVALDLDARSGGLESLEQYEADHGRLDRRAVQHTGGDGFHYLLARIEGATSRGGVAPGIDIKTGRNAYICVPPSLHASGKRYAWMEEPHPLSHPANEIVLPVAPEWVQKLVLGRKLPGSGSNAARRAPAKTLEQHITAALTRVARGTGRNDSGLEFFCDCRDDGYDKTDCKKILPEWVRRANDATPGEPAYARSEAEATLRSAFTRPPREPKKTKRVEDAENLSALVEDMCLFHDRRGDSYARIPIDGHFECWPIRSEHFRQVLQLRHYKSTGELAFADTLQNCIGIFDLKGHQGEEQGVFVRIGYGASGNGQSIYLDLGNKAWEAVEITSDGWRVTANPAVNFRRPSGLLALPTPVTGGSIEELRQFVNAEDDDTWTLILSWLVGVFQPSGAMAILLLQGSQGSGKSVMSTLLRRVIDPCAVMLESPPKDDRELAITCQNSGILALDNLSGLPAWLSDALCRVASGSGYKARSLYTNEEQRHFELRAPVLLNGIDEIARRADLLDRCIGLNLSKITDAVRRTERTIYSEFEAAHARILGALLTVMSGGLKNISTVQVVNAPRMADFAHWVVACEGALPIPRGSFLTAFRRNRVESARNAVEDDPFAYALLNLAARCTNGWTGTATELLTEVNARYVENGYRLPDRWPRDGAALSRWLRRAEPQLKLIGISVSMRREGKDGNRIIRIDRAPTQGRLISIDDRRSAIGDLGFGEDKDAA